MIKPGLMRVGAGSLQAEQVARSHPNGRRREDSGSRPATSGLEIILAPVPVVKD
jgi:hypothetical protein